MALILSISDLKEAYRAFGNGDTPVPGTTVLVVEMGGARPWDLAPPAAFPAVVVGVKGTPSRHEPAVSDDTPAGAGPDVAVSAGGLEAVERAVAARPLAALSLVHLMRLSTHLTPEEGLVAESLAYSALQSGPEFAAWLASRGPSRADPAGNRVRLTRTGDRLEVVLDRPHKHNAYDAAMRDALCEALAVAVADPTVQVVLRGDGASFCSGGDLDEFGTAADPVSAHLVRTSRSPAKLLAGIATRVRAEVHGWCIGSGIELAAFAGRVVADPGAAFRLPEVAMGLIPGAGGTVSLARRIGHQRTNWMALTGATVDAPTAMEWGLVDELSSGASR